MKKNVFLLLTLVGLTLVALFGYVSYGFLTSHPLFRWSIFAESIIFSISICLMGVILAVIGLVKYRKERRRAV